VTAVQRKREPGASVKVVPYSPAWPDSCTGPFREATIDILVVVDSTGEFLKRLPQVEGLGYDYHLHVLRSGSPEIDDYLLFRDALRSDPALAQEYERLKLALAAEYAADRTRYVTEKANWVSEVLASLHERRDE
jgi:GrpB-like predicted nucleotidyltransferase (UPF0157 family)